MLVSYIINSVYVHETLMYCNICIYHVYTYPIMDVTVWFDVDCTELQHLALVISVACINCT